MLFYGPGRQPGLLPSWPDLIRPSLLPEHLRPGSDRAYRVLSSGPKRGPAMKSLTDQDVRRYRELGYLAPIPVLTTAEATDLRRRLEAFETSGGAMQGAIRHKPHLLFTWLNELIRHPRILDAVEGIVGPDILCWGSSFFIKEPRNSAYVSWHQDSTYWGLEPPDIVTAWVAFSDSDAANGAMRVIPG